MMPRTSVLNKKKKKNASYQEQLDEHTISVKYVLIVDCLLYNVTLKHYCGLSITLDQHNRVLDKLFY